MHISFYAISDESIFSSNVLASCISFMVIMILNITLILGILQVRF